MASVEHEDIRENESMAEVRETTPLLPSMILITGLILVFVLGVWLWFSLWPPAFLASDRFSGIEALFGGLAFAGLIVAILLQREELSLQRRELELTRSELEGQKLQLEKQNETLSRQNLENTFFQLMRLHIDIVAAIEYWRVVADELDEFREKRELLRGRVCFEHLLPRLRGHYGAAKSDGGEDEAKAIDTAYQQFFSQFQPDVGHYLRNLYHVFSFIQRFPPEDRKFFSRLVAAQLSSHELALLFYNCLGDYGRTHFKPLVEEYGVLENLSTKLLFDQAHLALYSPSAYGSSRKALVGR